MTENKGEINKIDLTATCLEFFQCAISNDCRTKIMPSKPVREHASL